MLARDEQHLAESLGREMPCLGHHLLDGESDAQDWVIARKTAVTAVVDALIAQIERRKHPHGAAEILPGHLARLLCDAFELRVVIRLDQGRETPQQRRFAAGS